MTPKSAKRWGWLMGVGENGGKAHARKSILFQLGRTRCPIALKVFAEELCRLKPTATEAVKLIRRWQEWRDSFAAMYIADGGRNITKKFLEQIARDATKRRT